MGLVLTTDERGVKVWRDDKGQYPRYSISYSKKDEDGNWQNAYMEVRFHKGVELENGTEIMILDSFPSFNIGKDGKKYQFWFIKDYERMDGQSKVNQTGFKGIDIPVDIEEEELPFT